MANFTTKTIKEIYDGFISSYTVLRNKYGDTSPLLEKSVVKSLGYAMSAVAGLVWKLLIWAYKQVFPQTAELDSLKLWGNLVGVDYKTGVAANITLTISNATAAYLQTGTVYKDLTSGLIYKTISQAVNVDGTITATAVCSTSGTVGNIAIGTVLNIANPYDGIPQTAIVSAIPIQGTEDEEVETYRKRVLFKFRNKAQCGSALDYYTWGMEVSGITDILVYVLTEGVVSCYCVATGSCKNRTPSGSVSPNPYPVWSGGQFTELTGSGQFLEIANRIEGTENGVHDRRPVMASVKLEAPIYTGFSIEIAGLTSIAYNTQIKDVLISILDKKRPHNVALGYPESGGKINKLQLSAAVVEVIAGESYTSFLLKNAMGQSIDEAILGIGSLAYLSKLTINGTVIYEDV